MHPKSPKWLDDIVDAGEFILEITSGVAIDEYVSDRQLRQVTAFNFIIIGEALRRIEQTDPATAARIAGYRFAIDFRNRLVHRYDDIDDVQVWAAIYDSLPTLLRQTRTLLGEAERAAECQDDE
jgi:uncharacterized protein with HEPN domain